MFAPKVPPRPYQVQATKWLAQHDGGLLLLDTRTGKTKVAIDWMSWLAMNRQVTTFVVICPKVALSLEVWQKELKLNWWGPAFDLLTVDHDRFRGQNGKLRFWPSALQMRLPRVRVLLINFEYLSTPRPDITTGISRLDWEHSAIVLDESHAIKRPASGRSRRIVKLAKACRYHVAMTATPVSRRHKVDEVYPQLMFAFPGLRERWPTAASFRQYFAEWNNDKGFPEFVRPLHTTEYAELLADHSIALTREQALKTTPPAIQLHHVTLPTKAATLYAAVVADDFPYLEKAKVDVPRHVFTKYQLTRYIANGLVPLADGGTRKFTHKLPALLDAIAEVNQPIVCCTNIAQLKAVALMLGQRGWEVVTITGKTPQRAEAIGQWMNTDHCVLVAQSTVLATAIDLSITHCLVWWDPPQSWILFKQMSDRIALAARQPVIHMLLTRDTVDISLWHCLQEAKAYKQLLLQKPTDFFQGKV